MMRTWLALFPFLVTGSSGGEEPALFRHVSPALRRERIRLGLAEHRVVHRIGKVRRLVALEEVFVDDVVLVDVLVVSHIDGVRDFHVGAVRVRVHSLVLEQAGAASAPVNQKGQDHEHHQKDHEERDEDNHQRRPGRTDRHMYRAAQIAGKSIRTGTPVTVALPYARATIRAGKRTTSGMYFTVVSDESEWAVAGEVFRPGSAGPFVPAAAAGGLAEPSFPPFLAVAGRVAAAFGAVDVAGPADVLTLFAVERYFARANRTSGAWLMAARSSLVTIAVAAVDAERTSGAAGLDKAVAGRTAAREAGIRQHPAVGYVVHFRPARQRLARVARVQERNPARLAVPAAVLVIAVARVFQIDFVGCPTRPAAVAYDAIARTLAPRSAPRTFELLWTPASRLTHHAVERTRSSIHAVVVASAMVAAKAFELRLAHTRGTTVTSGPTRLGVLHNTRPVAHVIFTPSARILLRTLAFRLVHFRNGASSAVLAVVVTRTVHSLETSSCFAAGSLIWNQAVCTTFAVETYCSAVLALMTTAGIRPLEITEIRILLRLLHHDEPSERNRTLDRQQLPAGFKTSELIEDEDVQRVAQQNVKTVFEDVDLVRLVRVGTVRRKRPDNSAIAAVESDRFHSPFLLVGPVETSVRIVDAEVGRPDDLRLDQHLPVGAVRSSRLDPGMQDSERRPEYSHRLRIDGDGGRTVQCIADHRVLPRAVQAGHRNSVACRPRFGPVYLLGDPVHRDAADFRLTRKSNALHPDVVGIPRSPRPALRPQLVRKLQRKIVAVDRTFRLAGDEQRCASVRDDVVRGRHFQLVIQHVRAPFGRKSADERRRVVRRDGVYLEVRKKDNVRSMALRDTGDAAVAQRGNVIVVALAGIFTGVTALRALSEHPAVVAVHAEAGQSHSLSLRTRTARQLRLDLEVRQLLHEMFEQLRNSPDGYPAADVRRRALVVVRTRHVRLAHRSFVALVETVENAVAESLLLHALARPALPLGLAADRRGAVLFVGAVPALSNPVAEQVAKDAAVVVAPGETRLARPVAGADGRRLVRPIQTVGDPVAPPRSRHADAVPAAQLARSAAPRELPAVGFVRRVDAVSLAVAHPVARKTRAGAGAAELVGTRTRRAVARRRILVGAVRALGDAVADDRLPQAASVGAAAELALGAVAPRAVQLVRPVGAVLVVVAAPAARDAAAVVALEVRRLARRAAAVVRLVAAVVVAAVRVAVAPPRRRHAPARPHAAQVAVRARRRRAVGRAALVRPVAAVVVPVAAPDERNALLVVALELVPRAHVDRAALLVGTIVAVRASVADQRRRDTARLVAAALELRLEARVRLAVPFVRGIRALRLSVAELDRRDAVDRGGVRHGALEQLRVPADVRRAVGGLVGAVAAVVDAVASPPERNALVGPRARELRARAVRQARGLVGGQVVSLGAHARAVPAARSDEAQGPVPAAAVVGARIPLVPLRVDRLPQPMEHLDAHRLVNGVGDVASRAAGPPVGPLDALVLPVGPVDVVLERRDAEDVRKVEISEQVADAGGIEIGYSDVVELRVGPDYLVSHVVDR